MSEKITGKTFTKQENTDIALNNLIEKLQKPFAVKWPADSWNPPVFINEPYDLNVNVHEFVEDYIGGLNYLRANFCATRDIRYYTLLLSIMPASLYQQLMADEVDFI